MIILITDSDTGGNHNLEDGDLDHVAGGDNRGLIGSVSDTVMGIWKSVFGGKHKSIPEPDNSFRQRDSS